ncbi:MAG: hypothetical protein AAFR42_12150 [Cyanobacteria bacterium J06628_6]
MPLSPENQPDSRPAGQSPAIGTLKTDINQMFVLIEGILPFEACLYYQVLPLSIEGSCLNLGMVNLNDRAAADYVRRLVSYINCSIVPRQIPSDWHREILSKFLSHSAKSRAQSPATPSPTATPLKSTAPTAKTPPPAAATPTKAAAKPFAEQPTFVVSAPENLTESTATAAALSPETPAPAPSTAPQPSPPPVATQPPAATQPPTDVLPSLQHLSPTELTQALLDQVIAEGIGRLYLERNEQTGRILWSKDGVLQSVLEQIDPQVFQGVINELKLMVNLSLIPVRKPKQIEVEQVHRDQPILLRFRLIPGNHGEEATLQVLRGAALKFYQQQQIEKMGRDALNVAHTLQKRLDEIRTQARQGLPTDPVPNETLPAIIRMLKEMEQQVNEMMTPEP